MTRVERYLVLRLAPRDRRIRRCLSTRYPDSEWTVGGIDIPLAGRSPEEVLAECGRERIPVLGSEVRSG